jgi:hypothetical protein
MTAHTSGIQAIFIVGHTRSGTSLVNNIIRRHPRITGGNETRLFRHFNDMFEWAHTHETGIYSFHKDTSFLYALIKTFVNEYFITHAIEHQKTFFVEKTPSHELCLPLMKYCFPDARIVYCLRDGRDVWLSHREMSQHHPLWGATPSRLDSVALTWAQSVNICVCQEAFDDSQFHVMRYEQLIADPYYHIESVYDFCGVSFEEMPRQDIEEVLKYNRNATYENYQGGFPSRWKTHMSKTERETFKEIAGQALIRAGYEKDLSWD